MLPVDILNILCILVMAPLYFVISRKPMHLFQSIVVPAILMNWVSGRLYKNLSTRKPYVNVGLI